MRLFNTILMASLCLGLFSQETAQWRGPNRDGVYNEKGLSRKWPAAGPKMIWSFDELGEGFSSAAVTSSAVYITGMIKGTGYVFALNHQGKLLWRSEYGKEWEESYNGSRSTPLVIGNRLYIMSAYAKLVCMNTADGKIVWSIDFMKDHGARNITWGITENLLADGNVLYCTPGGPGTNVAAVDRNTGKIIWTSRGSGDRSAYCSPVIVNLPKRKVLVTMMEKSIQGFDAGTGTLLWTYGYINQYSVHPNSPKYIGGLLYSTSGYGLGGVMLRLSDDGSSVKQVWTNNSHDPKIGGFVVLNGRIYGGGDANRRLFCLDWNTGKEIYSLTQHAPSNIISNDGLLYIYSERGQVVLIEPKADAFEVLTSFNVPKGSGPHWAHLVIHNKRLYVRHGASLMVYDVAGS